MDSFAHELLDLVASSLQKEDVPRFRLVSRAFAMAGIRPLRIDKHFYLREYSLERLRSTVRHPTLPRSLKKIVFFVDFVSDFASRKRWAKHTRVGYHTKIKDDPLASKRKQAYPNYSMVPIRAVQDDDLKELIWEYYQEIRLEQKMLLGSSNVFKSLQHSLALFHGSLKSFTITNFEDHQDAVLLRGQSILSTEQAKYCFLFVDDTDRSGLVALCTLQAVLTTRQSCPVDLNVTNLAWSAYTMETLDSSLYVAALSQLETFRLSLTRHQYRRVAGELLTQLLRSMTRLRHLELEIQLLPRMNSQAILDACKWTGLACLELRGVDIDLPSFQSFLSSNAGSLKELCFAYINLVGIDESEYAWTQFLKFMAHNLDLSDLTLNGVLGLEHGPEFFQSDWQHQLRSGRSISVEDTARFLVCGRYPDLIKLTDRERQDISNLTWKDIDAAYE